MLIVSFTPPPLLRLAEVIFFLLQCPEQLGEKLEWDPCFKQAVYFLPPNYVNQSLLSLKYSVDFSTASGLLQLDFTGVH